MRQDIPSFSFKQHLASGPLNPKLLSHKYSGSRKRGTRTTYLNDERRDDINNSSLSRSSWQFHTADL